MTDRVVNIRLIAQVQGLVAGFKTAEVATKRLMGELEKSQAKRQALSDLGMTAGKVGAVAAVGFGLAVRSAANFEQSMSRVNAVLDKSDVSKLDDLRTAAIKAGARTQFSATEAAQGVEELTKAGVSASNVLAGGLDGALDLAAAGNLDVADAANIAATAMTQFGLTGDQVPHVADLLASAANKAQGEVSDMALAFKYVGPVAHSMGVSIEETAGTIALLANNGILGDQAGTSLRGMLTALTSPSKIAAKEMRGLGISMYDAKGQFVGLDGIAGQLHDRMKGLSNAERDQALGRIFGNQQITAARILYAGGADAVHEWTDKVNDDGAAATIAAKKMNNLKGSLEQLRGSFETALIGQGGSALAPLRALTDLTTDLLNAYTALPGPIKTIASGMVGLTAVAGLGAFAMSRLALSTAKTRAGMAELGLTFPGVRKSMASLNEQLMVSSVMGGKSAVAMTALRSGYGRAAAGAAGFGLQLSGLTDRSDALGKSTTVASDALMGWSIGGPVGGAIGAAVGLLTMFGGASDKAAEAQKRAAAWADVYSAAIDRQTGALTEAGRQQVADKLAKDGVIDATEQLGGSVTDLVGAMSGGSAEGARFAASLGVTTDQLRLIGEQANKGDMNSLNLAMKNSAKLAGPNAAALMAVASAFASSTAKAKAQREALDGSNKALESNAVKAGDAAKGLAHLTSAMVANANAILQARGDMRGYEAAIDDATAALKENGKTLDRHTPKGRANAAALDTIASSAISVADNMRDGSKQQVNFLLQARGQYVAAAMDMGRTRKQAESMAAEIFNLPRLHRLRFLSNIRDVQGQLDYYKTTLNNLPRVINTVVRTNYVKTGDSRLDSTARASGGEIRGPGSATSDSIPAWVSNGEFIVRAAQAQKHLGLLHQINTPGFASGGAVQFGVSGRRMTAGDIHSQIRELVSSLRETFGKDSPLVTATERAGKHMVEVAAREDKLQASLEKNTSNLRDLRDAQSQYASTVRSAFSHDIFGQGAAGLSLQLRADTNDARRSTRELRSLRRRGLSGGLFRDLAASGDTATIDQLSHMSRAQLRQLEQQYRARSRALGGLGDLAGNSVFGRRIREESHERRQLMHTIGRLDRRLERIEDRIGDRVEAGARRGLAEKERRATAGRRV